MNWFTNLFRGGPAPDAGARGPQASFTDAGVTITSAEQLLEALRYGTSSSAGQRVNETTALKVATVFACVRIRVGVIANTPLSIKRRVDERTRLDADSEVWGVLNRRPNKWQTPQQFKRMMEGHLQLRGNAYAVKVRGVGGKLIAVIPLHPDRVQKVQLPDLSLAFTYQGKTGGQVTYSQDEIFHLVGLSLDGVNGLSTLSYAREAIGLSLAMEQHGGTVFRNGANVSGAFKLPEGRTLSPEQADNLRLQLDDYRQGGARDGKVMVLEDGLSFEQMALNAKDAEWIGGVDVTRTDICMFFGVQPHMIGITQGNTHLGSSIDAQNQNFLTFSIEDSFICWEEAIGLQLLDWIKNPQLYARFNRNALLRSDFKTRWTAYVQGLQWGVLSPNEVRALEDQNPREGGDIYYPPPNTSGDKQAGNDNVPS